MRAARATAAALLAAIFTLGTAGLFAACAARAGGTAGAASRSRSARTAAAASETTRGGARSSVSAGEAGRPQSPAAAHSAGACAPGPAEARLARLLREDPGQQRPFLACDGLLERVARERARDMAERGYTGHVNPDGNGPNYVLRRAGYRLPLWWNSKDRARNSVEVIAWGFDGAEKVWRWWLDSPRHRSQVLGAEGFWREQARYGIGHFYDPGSRYRHYWVLITAPPPG